MPGGVTDRHAAKRVALRDVLIILVLAVVLRGPWLIQGPSPLVGDEKNYHDLAVRVLEGRGYTGETGKPEGKGFHGQTGKPTAFRTPGLPIMLIATYWGAGQDPTVARVVLVLVSSLTAPALYALCVLLFRRRSIALVAGLAWAVLPTSRRLAGMLLGEPLAALLLTVSLLLTVRAAERRAAALAGLSGLALGYAVLTRAYLLLVVPAPLVWLIVRRSRRLAVVLLIAVVVIPGAWVVRNWVRLGAVTLTTETIQLWQGNNAWARGSWPGNWPPQRTYLLTKYPNLEELDERDLSQVFVREAVVEVTQHPGRFLWLLPRKAAIFLSPSSLLLGFDWLYAVLLPFTLLGALRLVQLREHRHMLWLLGFPVIGVLVVCLVALAEPRFRHPVDPLVVVLAAVGLHQFVVRLAVLATGKGELAAAGDLAGGEAAPRP